MTISYLQYPVVNGYIHNWLVAGPEATLVTDLARYTGADYKLQIAQSHYQGDAGFDQAPAEMQPCGIADLDSDWEYYRCEHDHFVDLSQFRHECTYLRAWAYAEVICPASQAVTCILTTNGPADVWQNGAHVHRQEHFYHQLPKRVTFELTLQPGPNALLVRMEQVAARECPYAMALQMIPQSPGEKLAVRLPTAIPHLQKRQAFERALNAAFIRQDVFQGAQEVIVEWPEDYPDSVPVTIRLQQGNRIFTEGNKTAAAGQHANMGHAYEFEDGAYDLVVMPRPEEYYLIPMRIQRRLHCWMTRETFSSESYSDFSERRLEALVNAARREENVFSEIAKMALGAWEDVDLPLVRKTIEKINHRGDCSDFYLVGLLGMMYRYGDDPAFPSELVRPLRECVLGFKYWHDEPGSDAMCYTTENHSILFHTCEVLAGQLFPDEIFANNHETGRQHRARGERRALAWLADRATRGFKEWDSNCYFEEDTLALSHLLSLAEDDNLAAMATVVLDKLCFTMAVNSYKGVFGSTHGRTYTPFIKSAYNEATSGLSRLLWGMGVFNSHILGTVSLACADYEPGDVISGIASDLPEMLWHRERHNGELGDWSASGSLGPDVNKVTCKTPDFLLCSAQDYHPGERGYQQHIWQATLGPNAVVFVTHPPCTSEEGSHRPNFWHGNAILPRVAQWRDVLIAVHNLPADDWMGFTHAFFPVAAFDEASLEGGWAFARSGSGYIALTASQGLTWVTDGNNAYRELRSFGAHNIWLCQMGRAAVDGSFAEFQKKVLAEQVEFDDLNVSFRSRHGDEFAFGWQGPLLINGAEQPLAGFKHYEGLYCETDLPTTQMEIQFQDVAMRLDFMPEGQPTAEQAGSD